MSVSKFAPGGCCCGGTTPCFDCLQCCIPEADLTLNAGGPDVVLSYLGAGVWQYFEDDGAGGTAFSFTITCDADAGPAVSIVTFDSRDDAVTLVDFVCDPFHMHFVDSFLADYYVDYP